MNIFQLNILRMKHAKLILMIFSTLMMSMYACTPPQSSEESDSDTTAMADEGMESGAVMDDAVQATAVAQMEGKSGNNVTGTVTFALNEEGVVHLMVDLKGVPPGLHAIHIHEFGDCSAEDGTSAGGHWNPSTEAHGHINETEEFHYGDIGNIEADSDSTATFEKTVDFWTIGGEATSNIVGKSVIVHAGEDDFTSQPTGNAGGRIACGVIEMQ